MNRYPLMATLRTLIQFVAIAFAVVSVVNFGFNGTAEARDYEYEGGEIAIYVNVGEPTMVTFPAKIAGGYLASTTELSIERNGANLVIFAQPGLPGEGEAVLVQTEDKRNFAFRVFLATAMYPRDDLVKIIDNRPIDPEEINSDSPTEKGLVQENAPSSSVQGLMRELVLTAEFGKRKTIPGYRRSNRYSGETVIHDGAIQAKIDEIFMGANLWGYVLSVENQLDANHRINPAVFRLDGTRAISATRWELAPRPVTSEQKIANEHTTRIYIITRSKRR